MTGMQILSLELTAKHLELLTELLPRLSRVAMLHQIPGRRTGNVVYFDRLFGYLDASAKSRSIEAVRFTAATPDELDSAFADMRARRVQAVIVPASAFMFGNADRLATLATQYGLPTMYEISFHVEKGGLISYGYQYKDLFRRCAQFVARIFKRAKLADLPIQQATEFDLAVNLKTAKALGLRVPQSVLVRADRVIQ